MYQHPGARQAIQKWDSLPHVTFINRIGDEVADDGGCAIGGEFVQVDSKDLFANKKVVIFGLPGAFTPTCSSEQLPKYEEMYEKFKDAGVDEIYCVSVNDGFVMNAWAKQLGVEKVKLLSDGNADFTHGIGMLVNKRHLGFANRSWRYSLFVDNGIVQEAFVEPGFNNEGTDMDPYEVSDPATMLQYIEAENR